MAIFLALLEFVLIICLVRAVKHVRGLKGDYGRGVWSEWSPFLIDAKREVRYVAAMLICATALNLIWLLDA